MISESFFEKSNYHSQPFTAHSEIDSWRQSSSCSPFLLTHVRMYGESLLSFQFPLLTTMHCVFVWLSTTMHCIFVTALLSSNCLRSTIMQCVL